jgi:membrane-bound lytic murein transglycosylase A
VPLTPGRSIAVDRQHEYGTPFFIEADLPINNAKLATPFNRLMIAQDTGSAIVGPARADLYWGSGDDAGRIASRIRHHGRFVMLLPRELDMIEAGRHMPLPLPRPRRNVEVALNDHSKQNVVPVNADAHKPPANASVQPAAPAALPSARASGPSSSGGTPDTRTPTQGHNTHKKRAPIYYSIGARANPSSSYW